MIHILDGQENDILGVITAKNILTNNHRKSLKDNLETFNFRTFADKDFSQHLGRHNRVIIPSEDKGFIEFVIWESSKYRDSEGLKAEVYASASYLLLKKAGVIKPQNFTEQTASMLAGRALNGTEFQVGIVEGKGIRTMSIEEHTNPYAFLRRIAKEFGLELNFRVETDGNRITGRYVDLLEQIGQWRGREVEFGKDLIGIRRTEKTDNIYTALLGLGPVLEGGTRLEISVEDEDALQRWGRPDKHGQLQHLVDVYEPESTRENMTREELTQYTRTELDKRINAVVEYDANIADLEHVPGMENKKIRFGDTIKIKDLKFNPPLYIEARVHTQDRDIIDKSNKHVELGDFIEYTEAEVKAIWQTMQEEIRKKLDKLVLASIVSSAGNVFKNGIGSTELEVKTFLGGTEVDEDGSRYGYHWFKYDKDGELVPNFSESKKSITITAASIDEKASYTVHIALGTEILTMAQVTISNVFDGDDGEDGVDGKDGVPGLPGPSGKDGQSLYTWVKYATNASGTNMSDLPDGRSYIGFAYNKNTPVESTNPLDYEWAKIEGSQGSVGADGKTYYTWLKYATTPTSGMSDSPTGKLYMGLAYNKTTAVESSNYSDYDWSLIKGDKGDKGDAGPKGTDGPQGIPGIKGADGKTTYTWVKYANTPTIGMSDLPTGKTYIGFAYNKTTATESTVYADYEWAKFEGNQGVPGVPGSDGQPRYTWIKYADTETGSGMSDSAKDKRFLGLAHNKTTANESINPGDYTWSPLYDNVIVGGRNILLGSESVSMRSNNNNVYPIEDVAYQGHRRFRRIAPFDNTVLSTYTVHFYPVESGETYTLSVKVKPEKDLTLRLHTYGKEISCKAGKWTTLSYTYTSTSDEDARFMGIYGSGFNSNSGWIEYKEAQAEKGNVVTDWSPPPEDVEKAIEDVDKRVTTTVAEVVALDKEVRLKASQTDLNKVTGRVEHAETEIKLLPGKFDLTVQKNGVIGAINATPESLLIDFAKVKITGELEAKHIKSLAGLNINNQFVVDANGKVTIGNNRVTISENGFQITRPDGAIAMNNGIMSNAYNVNSYDPHYMTAGKNEHSSFPSFNTLVGSPSWYTAVKGELDGRGIAGYNLKYQDVRDALGALAFQQYEFIHSARYLVFSYWKNGSAGKHSLHVVNGTSDKTADRIYFETIEANRSGVIDCVIDLGKPNYRKRNVTFKIGWTHGWGGQSEIIMFRMVRVIQTDVL